jgi:hypothetical protein
VAVGRCGLVWALVVDDVASIVACKRSAWLRSEPLEHNYNST